VPLREWFVKRLIKQLKDEKEASRQASKGHGSNSQTLTPFNQPPPPKMMG